MVSPQMREQLRRVNDRNGPLVLLLLEHPSISPVRVVNDTRSWTIGGEDWIGLPFRYKLPDEVQGQVGPATLEIDNVGGDLTAELEQLPPGGVLLATTRVVSRAQPTVVDFELVGPLSRVSVTTTAVSAVVGDDDAMRSAAVKLRFDPQLTPELFAG